MRMQCFVLLDMLLQVTGITPGRATALVPVGLALVSMIAGWVFLVRSKGRVGNGRLGATVALAIGAISLVLSAMHLVRTSDTSIGTGSGRLGAIVAFFLGLAGILLNGLAVVRSRKKTSDHDMK